MFLWTEIVNFFVQGLACLLACLLAASTVRFVTKQAVVGCQGGMHLSARQEATRTMNVRACGKKRRQREATLRDCEVLNSIREKGERVCVHCVCPRKKEESERDS